MAISVAAAFPVCVADNAPTRDNDKTLVAEHVDWADFVWNADGVTIASCKVELRVSFLASIHNHVCPFVFCARLHNHTPQSLATYFTL
jgi:hypothetical protein